MANKGKKEIVIVENRDFKGIWIPERLYLTREFTPNEKFLLIEIYSLTKKKSRECFANNKHFADFVGLKENTVQKMMLKFENAGYIKRDYEYREGTKEIERRTIKLTQKFYKNFINETEETDSSANCMENNQEGDGFESMEEVDKNPQGDGLKVGEKYSSIKNNNNLSNKGKNINKVNVKVKTSVSEKKPTHIQKSSKQRYLDKKADEFEMLNNILLICNSDYDEQIGNEIFKSLEHYFKRYTQKTGLIHPILKVETLEEIIDKMANYSDMEYFHFGDIAEQEGAFIKIIDAFFDGDFGSVTGQRTNWHLPHFMSDGVLNRLTQRLWGAGEVY